MLFHHLVYNISKSRPQYTSQQQHTDSCSAIPYLPTPDVTTYMWWYLTKHPQPALVDCSFKTFYIHLRPEYTHPMESSRVTNIRDGEPKDVTLL